MNQTPSCLLNELTHIKAGSMTRSNGGPFWPNCAAGVMAGLFLILSGIPGLAQNALVNIPSPPGEQVNANVAASDVVAGELYGVWTAFTAPGPAAALVGWAFSPAGGVPGSWIGAISPSPGIYLNEWNPDIASRPMAGFPAYLMVSTGYFMPPYLPGLPDGILMNTSVGGGAPFGPPVLVMPNPPFTWLDYPVVAFSGFGQGHMAWTQFLDGDGDPDGNANFFDDAGDAYMIWVSYTSTLIGPFPYPGFAPPMALTPGPMPMIPNSMQMQRPAIAVAGPGGAGPFPPASVYVAWMDIATGTIMLDASELLFAGLPWGSLGGGISPVPTVPFAPIGPVIGGPIKAASSVTLAIHDEPGDPCDGNVYLAWADGGGPDADILFSFSPAGGLPGTWSLPVRVNQDPFGNGADQWAPSMEVDPATGDICITYYDRRSDPANVAIEVWSSSSSDCGLTWTDAVQSDAGPVPPMTSIITPPAPYVGDYLGSDVSMVTIPSTVAHIWNDGRNGIDQDIYFDEDCDCCNNRGNVDGIIGPGGPVDVSDLTYLVAYLFSGGPPPPCLEEGNVDGIVGAGGPIDVADLTYLVAFLFSGGPPPPPCP